jgi:hypothetical protein
VFKKKKKEEKKKKKKKKRKEKKKKMSRKGRRVKPSTVQSLNTCAAASVSLITLGDTRKGQRPFGHLVLCYYC